MDDNQETTDSRFTIVTAIPHTVVYSWILDILKQGFETFMDLVQMDDVLMDKIITAGRRLEAKR